MSQTDLSQLSDEELIELIHDANDMAEPAMLILLKKYKAIVRRKARTLFLVGGDTDDLIQEGMIALYKAVHSYHKGTAMFSTFADTCISNHLSNVIKASMRLKNIPLNTYISIYSPLSGDHAEAEDGPILGDTLLSKESTNPEDIFIDKESTTMIEFELGKRLSPFEKNVLDLYLNGRNYQEIARILGKSPKTIDNAIQRIRRKVVNMIH